jgi:hypothetical protein
MARSLQGINLNSWVPVYGTISMFADRVLEDPLEAPGIS